MSSPLPQRLEYAPPPPMARSRRIAGVAVRWGGVAALVLASLVYGPGMARQAYYLRAQRRCMAATIPAGQIVYANQPADATPLLASPGYKPVASVVGATLVPPGATPAATMSAGFSFSSLADVGEDTVGSYAAVPGSPTYVKVSVANAPVRTVGLLHAMHAPHNGADRLVAIVFLEREDPPGFPPRPRGRRLEINALVWRPATWEVDSRLQLAALSTIVLPGLDRRRVRLFAGQVDPLDASHFTLPYDIDGERGTIDGYLDLFDHVTLQVRDGPATDAEPVMR